MDGGRLRLFPSVAGFVKTATGATGFETGFATGDCYDGANVSKLHFSNAMKGL